MKFFTVILPLLAVLVQSTPVESFEELPRSNLTAEIKAKIRVEFENLAGAFTAEGIEPVKYYCLHYWDSHVFDQVVSNQDLNDKVFHFLRFVDRYSLQDFYFFCYPLMISLNPLAKEFWIVKSSDIDKEKIQIEFYNLKDAFAAEDINPKELYCLEHWKKETFDLVKSLKDLNDKVLYFWHFVEQYALTDTDLFCYPLTDSFKPIAKKIKIAKPSDEDKEKIRIRLNELKDVLAAKDIDPKVVFCATSWRADFENRVYSTPSLMNEIVHFAAFLDQYSLLDDDICEFFME